MKLKDYIEKHDMSLTDFAGKAGVPICNVWRYINGKRPSLKNFKLIKHATKNVVGENDWD